MPRIGVIADDLTGSNATGVLLTGHGLRVVTLTELAGGSMDLDQFDAAVVNTDSRSIPPREAYKRVKEAGELLKGHGVELFGKRIDSTIRGNLGAETDAVLDLLGEEALAVVTPAYPASGRVVAGGYLLVNGVPVQKTGAGTDPRTPVRQASIQRVLAIQSSRRMKLLDIDTVLQGKDAVAAELAACHREGARMVVADALTDEDIEAVAAGMLSVASAIGIPVVAVDAGPLIGALGGLYAGKGVAKPTKRIAKQTKRAGGYEARILAVCGSVTELTRQQLAEAEKAVGAYFVDVDVWALVEGGAVLARERERVVKALQDGLAAHDLLGLRTTRQARDVEEIASRAKQAGLSQNELAQRIARGLGLLAGAFLESRTEKVSGLFLTGGDVTVEVLRALGSHGLEMRDQVAPLVAYGTIFDGPYPGLPVVTKGGMVGDRTTTVEAVRYLQKRALHLQKQVS
ncbi:MAG: four-carbon acid sugar kinase family protein [Firmicutes bacterium]|nr:four-carbon acid sugar kinase family protein [Bacillota bacterium]